MSEPSDKLAAVRDLIVGTAGTEAIPARQGMLAKRGDHPVDVALRHAEDWVSTHGQARDSTRGGSTSPTEIEEGKSIAAVSRLAAKALFEIPLLVRELEDASRKLYDYTQRLTATLDLSKLPKDEQRDDECQSCRRSAERGKEKIGDHFAPVYEKAKKWGLCAWCWNHAEWSDDHRELVTFPPVEACHLMHTQSARAAGMWMAKKRAA